MAKKQKKQSIPEIKDGGYLLKIVLYMVFGSLWVKVSDNQSWQIPIPAGLILGLILTSHDHFKIDRKIEYAVLLVAAFVGFWAPIGIYITL